MQSIRESGNSENFATNCFTSPKIYRFSGRSLEIVMLKYFNQQINGLCDELVQLYGGNGDLLQSPPKPRCSTHVEVVTESGIINSS